MSNTLNPEILKTKHHFEILDGLRGVAAIAIVFFHFMEIVYVPEKNAISHGFLAVDFFFCLSGFVIAYAYDDRLGKMGIMEFFKSRIIRLHPLVIFGAVLGLIAFLFDPFSNDAHSYSIGRTVMIFLSTAFLIPFPTMEERFFNLFGLNAPSWSLFWEYVANIIYALVLFRLGRKVLLVLTILAAALLCYVAYRAKSMLGGWAGENFWDGGARIAYSFLAGLLIFRFKLILKSRIGFIGMSFLLLLAFYVPYSWGWQAELLIVLIYFPLLISLGAGATLAPGLKKLCNFSGNISYPLYMTHYAVMFMFLHYYTMYKPSSGQLAIILPVGTVLLIGFAYLVMRFYDVPLRKYITAKWKNQPHS